MIRRRAVTYRALLALTASLWAVPALAQAPQAAPMAQEKAAAPAKKANDPAAKPDMKGEKGGPKLDEKSAKSETSPSKADNKAGDPTVNAVERREPDEAKLKDRLQRRKHQQDSEHAKIAGALRGQPMSEAMKEELSRHARRLARLERIKVLALEAKDTGVVERVTKLIDKENARHDKFTSHFEGKGDKANEDKGKDDKGKDDKGKDDKGGAQ
ncbi:MAG TPA: hypothetical protein VK550_33865 [Polyangiaceae bacterium]|nr:hypothetical protein [Polyangiaceae bacterium]